MLDYGYNNKFGWSNRINYNTMNNETEDYSVAL